MINKHLIIKLVLIIAFSYIFLQAKAQSVYGNFPYYQSFRTSIQPGEIEKVTSQGGKTNAVSFTSNGLRLTPATAQQFGAVFIKDRQFQPVQGIQIEFEYVIYGGTGADGLSIFLFDADIQNPTIGAPGCGIGYTYNRTNNSYTDYRASGLDGAYLGIALDSYGNFKQRRWQVDARVNGISDTIASSDNRCISNVTLRGARGGSNQLSDFPYGGMGDGYTGYPVLVSQPTLKNSQGWILNEAGDGYTDIGTYQGDFSLRGGSLSAYRKAIIELFPFTNGDGFWVTIKIQHEQSITTVIDGYHYRTSLIYTENAHTATGDYNNTQPKNPISASSILDASIPEFLRVGLAASTGAQTDIHLLRELKITLPSSAEAYDDTAFTPKRVPVIVDVLNNDIGYSGLITRNQAGSKNFLNPYTFRFCNDTGASLGTVDLTGTSYSTADGLWRFDFTTQKLTFTPVGDFIGQATVKYNIKAGLNNETPYNDEAYRSLPATVTVDVITPKAAISNRMATPIIIPR